jgi:hypothetical protein
VPLGFAPPWSLLLMLPQPGNVPAQDKLARRCQVLDRT